MTNGEKILNAFSNATIRRCKNKDFTYIEVEQNDKWIADFNIEWWEAECKEPTTKNDCEHCAKTYGTLGCCDYVNNEPVYSCKEGHEEYARGLRKFGSTTNNNLGVDCISRQAVLEITAETGALETQYRVKALPSVTPQEPRWIPVSKKLPKLVEWYLTSIKWVDGTERVIISWFDGTSFKAEVKAWMPLPKPYEEVEG